MSEQTWQVDNTDVGNTLGLPPTPPGLPQPNPHIDPMVVMQDQLQQILQMQQQMQGNRVAESAQNEHLQQQLHLQRMAFELEMQRMHLELQQKVQQQAQAAGKMPAPPGLELRRAELRSGDSAFVGEAVEEPRCQTCNGHMIVRRQLYGDRSVFLGCQFWKRDRTGCTYTQQLPSHPLVRRITNLKQHKAARPMPEPPTVPSSPRPERCPAVHRVTPPTAFSEKIPKPKLIPPSVPHHPTEEVTVVQSDNRPKPHQHELKFPWSFGILVTDLSEETFYPCQGCREWTAQRDSNRRKQWLKCTRPQCYQSTMAVSVQDADGIQLAAYLQARQERLKSLAACPASSAMTSNPTPSPSLPIVQDVDVGQPQAVSQHNWARMVRWLQYLEPVAVQMARTQARAIEDDL